MAAALQALYGFGSKVVFFSQRLDDEFVIKRDAQPGGDFLTHGAAAASKLTVDGDDESLFSIHGSIINRVKIRIFYGIISGDYTQMKEIIRIFNAIKRINHTRTGYRHKP